VKPRVSWLAGDAAGLGHARFGSDPRTACGERAIDARHAWPIRARCPICTAAVARLMDKEAAPAAR